MAPHVVYTDPRQSSPAAPGDLFAGKKFWIAQRCPTRSDFVNLVRWNGGQVVPLEKQADYLIHDHARKDSPPGALSYRFIEQSVRDAEIKNPEDHLCGPPSGTVRPAGLARTVAGGRVPYSAADDVELYQWVKQCESQGLQIKGNKIYEQLAERNPRHPAQSWRDRYLKILVYKPPMGADTVAANPPPSSPSDESNAKSRKRKLSPAAGSSADQPSSAPTAAKTRLTEPSAILQRRSSPAAAESETKRKTSPDAVVSTSAPSSSAPKADKTHETKPLASVNKEVEREREQPETRTSSSLHAPKAAKARGAESPASAQRKLLPAVEIKEAQPSAVREADPDQSPQIKEETPAPLPVVVGPPFTVRDLGLLMETAFDIQNIRRCHWKHAWKTWADAYPPFTANEWEEFWETTVLPIWLEQEDDQTGDKDDLRRIYEKAWHNWTAQQGMEAPAERWVQFFNAEVIPIFRKHEAARIEQEIKKEKDDAEATPAPAARQEVKSASVPRSPLAGIEQAATQDALAEQTSTTSDVHRHNLDEESQKSSPHIDTDASYEIKDTNVQLHNRAGQTILASAEPQDLSPSPLKDPSDAEFTSPIAASQSARSTRKRAREEGDIVEADAALRSVKRQRNDTPDSLVETAQESVEVSPKVTATPDIMAEEQEVVDISSGVPESSPKVTATPDIMAEEQEVVDISSGVPESSPYVSSREPEPETDPEQEAPELEIRSESEPELSEEESHVVWERAMADRVEQAHEDVIVPVGRIREVVRGLSPEMIDYLLSVFRERPTAPLDKNWTGGEDELYMHTVHFFSQVNSEPSQDLHVIGQAFEDLGIMDLFDVDQDDGSEASSEDDDESDEPIQETFSRTQGTEHTPVHHPSPPPQLPHELGEASQKPAHRSPSPTHLPTHLPQKPEQQVAKASPSTPSKSHGREDMSTRHSPSPQPPRHSEKQNPKRDPEPVPKTGRRSRFSGYLQKADHKAYITSRTAPPYRYTEDQVVRALHATCMHGALSDEVLGFMRSHRGAVGPANKKGIWTGQDDRELRSGSREARERVERKHGGEKICAYRRRYLELFG